MGQKIQQVTSWALPFSDNRNEQVVDIGDAAFITSLNLMSSTLFSTDFAQFNSKSSQETKEVVRGLMTVGAVPNLADFFPVLKFIDPQGLLRETKSYISKVFVIFDDLINQRLKSRGESLDHPVKNDFLEAILNHNQTNQSELTFDVLKHLLLDLFVAGTDTTSSTVEWAMTELLRNPEKIRQCLSRLAQSNCEASCSVSLGTHYSSLNDMAPLQQCNEQEVDIGDAGFITSLNLMSATLFWTDFAQFNSKSSQETKEVYADRPHLKRKSDLEFQQPEE
ncbi:unnamed protein product [Fraxinus pennsylvanica]|uniref:Cytochrome P450 76AD1-like protein n=1 Tax=Fraxinus pennsylvanica TaxID=56036 RepID=A0AAD2DXT3_9LAMI|nr:unnamed protein product [Fraxinus pennsylvanica]